MLESRGTGIGGRVGQGMRCSLERVLRTYEWCERGAKEVRTGDTDEKDAKVILTRQRCAGTVQLGKRLDLRKWEAHAGARQRSCRQAQAQHKARTSSDSE